MSDTPTPDIPPVPIPPEVKTFDGVEHDAVRSIDKLYAGLPVYTATPTFIGRQGEIVIVDDGALNKGICTFTNGSWNCTSFLTVPHITLDNFADVGASGGATTNTTFTVVGSNPVLFVAIATDGTHAPTGVTYNGIALTLLDSTTALSPDNLQVYVYYLISPNTGSHTLAITLGGGGHTAKAIAASYSNANQSSQPDAYVMSNSNGTTHYTNSVTTTVDQCWVIMFGLTGSSNTITQDGGTILRYTVAVLGSSSFFFAETSVLKNPAGVVTMGVTSSSQNISSIIISIKP